MGLVDDILQGWPVNSLLREQVSQLNAQKAAVETELAIIKDDNRQLVAENENLKKQVEELSHTDDLDEIELNLLQQIAQLDYENCFLENIAHGINLSRPRIEYHIQRLEDLGYAESGLIDDYGNHYGITQAGRSLLLKRNLL